MVAVKSAGWGGDREDGGDEECCWSANSAGWEPEVIAVWRHLSRCWFRVRFVCVLRAFCVRARHACMFGVRVRR